MHRLAQYPGEQELFDELFSDVPLHHACNRYIAPLCELVRGITMGRMKMIGVYSEEPVIERLSWSTVTDEVLTKPLLACNAYGKNVVDGHSRCLSVNGNDTILVKAKTYIEGKSSTGEWNRTWQKMHNVFDDLADQHAAALDRILSMQQIIKSAGGSLFVSMSTYSMCAGIQTSYYVSYRGHLYDHDVEKPCAYSK